MTPFSMVNITVMGSKITIIIPMVSNVMTPFSMITEVAPVSVVGITVAPFSMVAVVTQFSVSSVVTVVAPGKGITVMGITMMGITVVAPWLVVFVSMNNSNL